MNSSLVATLKNLVNDTATKKIIYCHSKPWIDREVSEKIKILREARKKFVKHRSERNSRLLEKARRDVIVEISEARQKWVVEQCNKLSTANENERWKIINKITNSKEKAGSVQPILVKQPNGDEKYIFDDEEIIEKMEEYIRKMEEEEFEAEAEEIELN